MSSVLHCAYVESAPPELNKIKKAKSTEQIVYSKKMLHLRYQVFLYRFIFLYLYCICSCL